MVWLVYFGILAASILPPVNYDTGSTTIEYDDGEDGDKMGIYFSADLLECCLTEENPHPDHWELVDKCEIDTRECYIYKDDGTRLVELSSQLFAGEKTTAEIRTIIHEILSHQHCSGCLAAVVDGFVEKSTGKGVMRIIDKGQLGSELVVCILEKNDCNKRVYHFYASIWERLLQYDTKAIINGVLAIREHLINIKAIESGNESNLCNFFQNTLSFLEEDDARIQFLQMIVGVFSCTISEKKWKDFFFNVLRFLFAANEGRFIQNEILYVFLTREDFKDCIKSKIVGLWSAINKDCKEPFRALLGKLTSDSHCQNCIYILNYFPKHSLLDDSIYGMLPELLRVTSAAIKENHLQNSFPGRRYSRLLTTLLAALKNDDPGISEEILTPVFEVTGSLKSVWEITLKDLYFDIDLWDTIMARGSNSWLLKHHSGDLVSAFLKPIKCTLSKLYCAVEKDRLLTFYQKNIRQFIDYREMYLSILSEKEKRLSHLERNAKDNLLSYKEYKAQGGFMQQLKKLKERVFRYKTMEGGVIKGIDSYNRLAVHVVQYQNRLNSVVGDNP